MKPPRANAYRDTWAGTVEKTRIGDEGISLKDMESGEQEIVESPSAAVARALKGRHPG